MNRLLLFLFLIITNYYLSIAQPHIQWQKTYGGTGNDYSSEIQQTFDGGFIVAGSTRSNDGDVTGNHGGEDYWVIKINGTGTIEWQKTYGGSADDVLLSIKQTTDSGYIASGYAESNDSDVTGNHGFRDFWVIKIDKFGTLKKQKCFGGSNFEIGYSVQQTTDGGYAVAGYSNSQDGDLTINNGAQNYWLIKLDTALNIQWQKLFGGSYTDEANTVQQTFDGGYVLSGYINSSNGYITGYHGAQDGWIVKTDGTGTFQWQNAIGGTASDGAWDIRQTNDGGYIVAASTASNDSDVTGNHGDKDQWIVKLDSAGNIQWQKCIGGSLFDSANEIFQTTDGGFITSGYSTSNDGDVSGNHGDADSWIVKMDSLGTLQWQKTLGGTGADASNSIQQTADGGFIVLGYTLSNDGDVSGNHGNSDIWIVKLDSSANLSLSEIQKPGIDLQIIPNPFSEKTLISFELPESGNVSIQIFDIEGRLVKNVNSGYLNVGKNEINWDATNNKGSKLNEGVYVINIFSNNIFINKRVINLR